MLGSARELKLQGIGYPCGRDGGRKPSIAVTSEELRNAGASVELTAIPFRELRCGDMAGDSMAVGLTAVLLAASLGFMGWLAVTVTDLRGEMRANQAQTEARIDALAADVAEVKAGLSEVRKLLLEGRN